LKKLLIIVSLASKFAYAQSGESQASIQKQVWNLTEVMYHDVVNPPAAARFYAYSLIAGLEVLSLLDTTCITFHHELNDYSPVKIPSQGKGINRELAVLYSISETGRLIIPSGALLEKKQVDLVMEFRVMGVQEDQLRSSIQFAQAVAQHIVQYARGDGYFRLSALARFKPSGADSCWRPTPPEYMSAVEPYWKTLRPFLMDSVQQFRPATPVSFDPALTSDFMSLAKEVYESGLKLTPEQRDIAQFWDCNPFAVQYQGHMSIGLKKISPGGHWMGIAGIASQKAGLDLTNTLLVHTISAITLHDAFASCWDEKFRSNRIRPETVINRYIDPKWKPFLQTPPFPEYSSGHSVISTAMGEVLTFLFGEGFLFTDSIEMYIGLSPRFFTSFREAAAEARISRLYGGIHFRDAIENGADQGKRIGEFVIRRLKLAKIKR
jgi:hypothetical protein